MRRLAVVALAFACYAFPALAQHGGSHSGSSAHGGGSSFHGGTSFHGGVGSSAPSRGFAPARMSPNRPAGFARSFPSSGPRFRQPFADSGHHRMPYRSPHDHDHDRRRGYGWSGVPLWTGWGYPFIPNYPLFYGDDFADSDSQQPGYSDQQGYSDQAGYGAGQPNPNYPGGYGPDYSAQPPSPSPYDSAGPSPAGAPYQPSPQLPREARAPYRSSAAAPLSESTTVPESPLTLVFRDGRPPEKIHNYLLTATTLSILDQHHRDIPIDQLDLAATARVNREAGVDFQLPGEARP